MKTAQFLFDFGSPNAYLAHKVIPGIEARTGVKFEYIPALLGGIFKATGNKSPMEAFGHIPRKMAYEQLETQRFIARHKITQFKFNPFFPVNTLAIMRGAVAAHMRGELPRYADAVFHNMWEEPKKMDDPIVIHAALTSSGLDADALIAAGQTPDVKACLMKNTEDAVKRGVFGSPSFFVGNQLYFGKDRLRDVEEALAG